LEAQKHLVYLDFIHKKRDLKENERKELLFQHCFYLIPPKTEEVKDIQNGLPNLIRERRRKMRFRRIEIGQLQMVQKETEIHDLQEKNSKEVMVLPYWEGVHYFN